MAAEIRQPGTSVRVWVRCAVLSLSFGRGLGELAGLESRAAELEADVFQSIDSSFSSGARPRRLGTLLPLPDGTTVELGSPAVSAPFAAAVAYSPLTITSTEELATTDSLSELAPEVRIVPSSVTDEDAAAGACDEQAVGLNIVSTSYARGSVVNWTGVALTVDAETSSSASSDEPLEFLMGGRFKLCYSDTGNWANFSHVDVLEDQELVVNGVYDPCDTSGCLATRGYYCYASKLSQSAAGSCVLTFADTGQGIVGDPGLGSWTPAFEAPTYNDATGVAETETSASRCGTELESAEDRYIGTDGSDRFIDISDSTITIPQTLGTLSGETLVAFTVAACYCPDVGGCDEYTEFTQQIGKIYFFVSRVCLDEACSPDFVGVMRKVPFALRVDCPPDACGASNESRVKFVAQADDNDLPSWDSSHGCRTAEHSSVIGPEGNCESATDCSFSGGTRQDYKYFTASAEGEARFSWLGDLPDVQYGAERYDLRHDSPASTLDVCFCESSCGEASSWFKVGSFRLSPFNLVGHSLLDEASLDIPAVEYANVPGIVGLSAVTAEEGSLGFAEGGIIKVLSDNELVMNDDACRQTPFDPDLLATGPTDGVTASESYAGSASGAVDEEKLIFDSGLRANTVSISRAGVIVLCYCQSALETGCSSESQWALIGRLMVKGPVLGQHWELSVNVVSGLELLGFGLESTDVLRLLDPGASCTENDGNPRRQDTSVSVGCPDNCVALDNTPGAETNIATQIVADDAVGCDASHSSCSSVALVSIDTTTLAHETSVEGSRTLLTFAADPGLDDGDVIALGPEVTGGTDEELATMRGVFPFADDGEYTIGLRVTREGTTTFSVPVGWPASMSSPPTFSVAGSAGTWKRHSRASTKEELRASEERLDLKLCWAASTPTGGGEDGYVAEVGTVSFVLPPAMPEASVVPVSSVVDQAVPTIVAFSTGARSGYMSASSRDEVTELRLLVTSIDALEVDFASGSAITSADSVDRASATRVVCGQIFEELWSSEGRGFPLPSGCYYGPERELGASSSPSREISLVFEPGAGLAPSARYQFVLRATARLGLQRGDEVIHIFALASGAAASSASGSATSVAVELGRGAWGSDPADATSDESPLLDSISVGGGASASVAELDEAAPLQVLLTGDATREVIAGANLRLVFRPLTSWGLGAACVATCTPSADAECGTPQSCSASALVEGEGRNIAHIVLSTTLTPVNDAVTPTLELWGLSLPAAGFFSTRLGAQLTDADDLYPQYLESTDFLLVRPAGDAASSAGALLTSDGDSQPFKGDTGNELYARLIFGTTLRSVGADGDASFTVKLPGGYTCVSASAPEADLAFFDLDASPKRGASLADGSDGSWDVPTTRKFRFSLAQDAVIYAGTVVVAKFVVDNPAEVLPASSTDNVWTLTLTSKGEASAEDAVAFEEITFAAPSEPANLLGRLAGSVPVLGVLTDAVAQPSTFAVGEANEVSLFFRAEQSSGLGAQLRLVPPAGFAFVEGGEGGCVAGDVVGSVYNTAAPPASQTLRLPGLLECSMDGGTGVALLSLAGELVAGTRYAFQVAVRNPGHDVEDVGGGWSLTVLTASGDGVDATREDMALNPIEAAADAADAGWAPYNASIDTSERFAIQVSSYLPFSLASTNTVVTIFPITFPENVTAKLRIVAPEGFEWGAAVAPAAKFEAEDAASGLGVTGASADLPGGLPTVSNDNSVLEWSAVEYSSEETYGFVCELKVPDANPTGGKNSFFVEVGDWTSSSLADRLEAGVVPAGDVRALRDASVQPTQRVVGGEGPVEIQIRTVTEIPETGALRILTPPGFVVAESCKAEALEHPEGAASLEGGAIFSCEAEALSVTPGESAARTAIILSAGRAWDGGGLPSGLYRFSLSVANPSIVAASAADADDATAGGVEECWTIQAFEDLTADEVSVLDLEASAAGFAVLNEMPHAELVHLTEAQRLAIRRSDRPGRTSRLVLAMELRSNANVDSEIVVTAPPGALFAIDCLSGIKVNGSEVFGSRELWTNDTYQEWPASAVPTSCRGSGNVARLSVGPGFLAERLYAWQVELLANPSVQPPDASNVWTISLARDGFLSETSVFPSFALATFDATSLVPASPAQGAETPLFVDFRPRAEVSADGGGALVLRAPPAFQFLASEAWACDAELHTLLEPEGDEGSQLGPLLAGMRCRVDEDAPSVLVAELGAGTSLSPSSRYRLIASVRNPDEGAEGLAQAWTLQSFRNATSTDLASDLDEALLPGYLAAPAAALWSVGVVVDEGDDAVASDSLPRSRGLETVELRLWARTAAELLPGDTLEVAGPSMFSFVATQPSNETCGEYSWDPDASLDGGPLVGELDGAALSCPGAGRLLLTFEADDGAASAPPGALFALLIATRNPRVTPPHYDNYWRFTHIRAGAVVAAAIVPGYVVTPQLENAEVALLGPLFAAGSRSSIQVTFRAVSEFNVLRFTALAPPGIVLSSAELASAVESVDAFQDDASGSPIEGATLVLLDGSSGLGLGPLPAPSTSTSEGSAILFALRVPAEHFVRLTLTGVRLASTGGATHWRLETFDGATSLDEREFVGFRQPGSVSILGRTLENELQPSLEPIERSESEQGIMSLWGPRVRAPAMAVFTVRISNEVVAGETLVVDASVDCELLSDGFELYMIAPSGAQVPVAFEVNLPSNASATSTLEATLLEALGPQTDLHLMLPMVAATRPSPRGFWRIEIRAPGEPLPTHTNDNLTPGFELVEIFAFSVSAVHAPPTSTFVVTFEVDLAESFAAELHIVLPTTWSAPLNCTAAATALCEQRGSDGIQRRIFLFPPAGRVFYGNLTLKAYVTAPIMDAPDSPAWLLSGVSNTDADASQVGWGEDRSGVALTPMTGVTVQYAAVPLTTVSLAISLPVRRTPGSATTPRLLKILPPTDYELTCDERFLRLISLPRNRSVCSVDPLTLGLEGDRPFPEGDHTFMVGVEVPRLSPSAPEGSLELFFKVLLLDDDPFIGGARVADSNMEVPAQPVQSLLLRAQQPTLAWTFSRPLSEPFVTISIRFERLLPEGWTPLRMAALLLEIPEGFTHVMTKPSDVRSLNSEFPHPKDWAEFDIATGDERAFGPERTLRKVRLLREESKVVPKGTYKWSLPVSIPLAMPSKNLWRFALCNSPVCGTIPAGAAADEDGFSTGSIATFVIPGFLHGEDSPAGAFDPEVASSAPPSPRAARSRLRALLGALLLTSAAAAASS